MSERKTTNTPQGHSDSVSRGQPLHNRVAIALLHSNKLSFSSVARLSQAVGCSRSTIWRMLHGKTQPSYALVEKVTQAIADDLGLPLVPSDLFSTSGTYRLASGCRTFGCTGCFPEEAWGSDYELTPEFQGQRPGDWSLAPRKNGPEGIPLDESPDWEDDAIEAGEDPEDAAFFQYK